MIAALLIMTTLSFSFRIAPFIFSKWLNRWTFLEKLALSLPACILILLVAHNLEHGGCGLTEIVALSGVIVTQLLFRSILLSMVCGVLLHQFL